MGETSDAGHTVYTFCRICEARCGLAVSVANGEVVQIAPDKQNPHSWRDFCAKGRTAGRLLRHDRRILSPMRRVGDRYVEATWDEAIADISLRLRRVLDEYGPDAIGAYWGNPNGWAESNHLARDAFLDAIGTTQRYNSASLDNNSALYVCNEMYGTSRLFLIPDVDRARCMLLVGTNPAVSAFNWMCSVPGGWSRVRAAQADGADLIVVDPRRTKTAAAADNHVVVRPGQDWAFLLGLVKVVVSEGMFDVTDSDDAEGFAEIVQLVADVDLQHLSAVCDVPVDTIEDVARRFAGSPTGFCFTATGVAHHTTGTVAEWLGHVLNVITGRLDRPGGRYQQRSFVDPAPFQARLKRAPKRPSRVRGLPPLNGTHSMAEIAGEISTPGPGQLRAMIIHAGNPVNTGPSGADLDRSLEQLDLLVAVDFLQRESHRHADWLIPAPHWLERDDLLLSFAASSDEPFVQHGPRAVPPPPGVRPEWQFFIDLGLAMKVPLFGRRGANTVIRLSRGVARLTGLRSLAFHPRWYTRLLLKAGRTLSWNDIVSRPHGYVWAERRYGVLREHLAARGRRIVLAPPPLMSRTRELLAQALPSAPVEFPFVLINKREKNLMNSWLSDLDGLHRRPGGEVEMNPVDAAELDVADGDMVRVTSSSGAISMPVSVTDAVTRRVITIGHGWGSRVFDPYGRERPVVVGSDRNLLVSNVVLDPLSQIPALNSTHVNVTKVRADSG